MRKNKMFKNKVHMVCYFVVFFLLLGCFIYLGNQNYDKGKTPDNEKFDLDFSLVDKDNVFHYVTNTEARLEINKGKTILFFGTKNNEWVNHYAKILNEVAKEVGINTINYYDFIQDRKDNNGTYESIVELLGDYVLTNDLGVKEIYAPTLMVIKDDEILYFDDETAFIKGNTKPDVYWNEYQIGLKKATLERVFLDYLGVVDEDNGE